jgi:hypothetical protein
MTLLCKNRFLVYQVFQGSGFQKLKVTRQKCSSNRSKSDCLLGFSPLFHCTVCTKARALPDGPWPLSSDSGSQVDTLDSIEALCW